MDKYSSYKFIPSQLDKSMNAFYRFHQKKFPYNVFFLKRLLFDIDHFELYDYFLAKKRLKFTKCPPKMLRHEKFTRNI
jgi:hypothetical protein